jgi:hypothetical protein
LNIIAKVIQSVWDKTNNLINVGIKTGSALIGTVSIDQTTPGTTNKVYNETLGATTDDKNASTDTTSISVDALLKYISHILQASMGAYDGAVIDDTTTTTPSANHVFCNIMAIGTSNLVIDTVSGSPDISGKTLVPGASIPGEWSSIKFTSGEGIAYQKES